MATSKKTGGVNLPFGEAAKGQVRFPQELGPEELGDNCPLCCPTCFAALRASKVDSDDPARGLRLVHRRGAGGCTGAEQRHVPAAYIHAAKTCEGKFFWTPELRPGDEEPHGFRAAEAASAPEDGNARLYKVGRVLTGSQAQRRCGGAREVGAVFELCHCETGRHDRDVAIFFADSVESAAAEAAAAAGAANEAPLSIAVIVPLGIQEMDGSFALAQLQDEILGCGDSKSRRFWLFDAEAAAPEEPVEEPDPEPDDEEVPEPEPEPEPQGRGLFGRARGNQKPRGRAAAAYCRICGNPLPAGAVNCPSCGAQVAEGSGKDHTLKLVAFVFCAIGFAFMALGLLVNVYGIMFLASGTAVTLVGSLILCLLFFALEGFFTLRCWKVYKGAAPNTWLWAILTLLLCNLISGVLLCIASKDE